MKFSAYHIRYRSRFVCYFVYSFVSSVKEKYLSSISIVNTKTNSVKFSRNKVVKNILVRGSNKMIISKILILSCSIISTKRDRHHSDITLTNSISSSDGIEFRASFIITRNSFRESCFPLCRSR